MKMSICFVAALASLAIASPTPEVSISMEITSDGVAVQEVCLALCMFDKPTCPETWVCQNESGLIQQVLTVISERKPEGGMMHIKTYLAFTDFPSHPKECWTCCKDLGYASNEAKKEMSISDSVKNVDVARDDPNDQFVCWLVCWPEKNQCPPEWVC